MSVPRITTPLEAGVYLDIPKEQYLGDPCPEPSMSASMAPELLRSPAHARQSHPRFGGIGRERTEAMRQGLGFDSILLGGDTSFSVIPEFSENAKGEMVATNGELRLASVKAWAAAEEAAGRLVVKREELTELQEKAGRVRENLMKRWGLDLDAGTKQATLIWQAQGCWARGRLDLVDLEAGRIVDVKIVNDASPDGLGRKVWDFAYDIQRAAYVQGLETLRPELQGRTEMLFAFCEAKPPHETLLVPLDGSFKRIGEWRWSAALARWRQCLDSNHWPGYVPPRLGVAPPPWAMQAYEEAAMGGGSPGLPW